MTDKTPIEKIDDIYSILQSLQKQMSIMDVNIKLLNSKANGELFKAITGPSPDPKSIPDLDKKATVGVPLPKVQAVQPKNKTTVQGKLFTDQGKPLPGATVKIILQANNQVIEETRTNMAGVWTKFLKPGKYIAKYVHETKPTQFRLFEVKPGQDKLTVQ